MKNLLIFILPFMMSLNAHAMTFFEFLTNAEVNPRLGTTLSEVPNELTVSTATKEGRDKMITYIEKDECTKSLALKLNALVSRSDGSFHSIRELNGGSTSITKVEEIVDLMRSEVDQKFLASREFKELETALRKELKEFDSLRPTLALSFLADSAILFLMFDENPGRILGPLASKIRFFQAAISKRIQIEPNCDSLNQSHIQQVTKEFILAVPDLVKQIGSNFNAKMERNAKDLQKIKQRFGSYEDRSGPAPTIQPAG